MLSFANRQGPTGGKSESYARLSSGCQVYAFEARLHSSDGDDATRRPSWRVFLKASTPITPRLRSMGPSSLQGLEWKVTPVQAHVR